MNSPKIPEGLQTFLSHAESLHPSNNAKRENGFAREFQQLKALSSQLKKNPEYSCHHGEMECNRPKNRYKDIVPFDYNRIILPTLPGVPGSDYINGNYVKGADGNMAYLAAQGPLPRTVDDFWRLIASHKCQIVIMVCKEIEMGKLKCKRYWPESKDEKLNFAGLEISLISEDDIAEGFIMRTMLMKSGQEEMMVTQLQYTAWPDHDVPKSAEPLIEMNKTLRALQGNRKQQVLIHCSAGCGRTGTICAVDFAWSLLKMQKTNNFSVYDIVANLRRQRMAMVQTKEQYQLVYKAVVQLVNEELEQEKFKFHTYVNVNVPGSPKSPPGHSNYENCEFIRSVGRWKQSDLQNGSVPRAPLSLPLEGPKETKTDRRSSSGNKAAIPPPSPEERTAKSGAEKNKDYVNVEFVNKNDLGSKLATASSENKPAISTKPTLPPRDLNKPILDSNAVNGAVPSHSAGQQKSPTAADYEVLPKAASSPAFISSGKVIAVPNNKGSVSDYEILPPPAHGDKKQARHVPEGLLIDLGDDVPPLPDKRHSLGSSRYESVEVKPLSPPGVSSQRSSSSPNVQDDMFLLGGGGLQHQATGLQNAKKVADSKGFHTVPNRLKPTPGPKRCPVTPDLFEDPHASVGGGFKVMNSPTETSGQYSLVGAISPPSPPKVSLIPVAQSNPGAGLQMTTPRDKGQHPSPPRKQADKPSKARLPVGAYSLVGIPETGSQMPVVVGTAPGKQNTAAPVEVKAKPVVPVDIKGKPGVPVDVKSKPGAPVEVKGKPTAEPSYELVGQWQQPVRKVSPPTPSTDNPKSAGIRNAEANKGMKGELQGSPHFRPKVIKEKGGDKSDVIPGIFLRGQGDGEVASGVTVIGTDVYAAVGPRELRGSSSPNINSRSSPKLRNQTSSSSLSCASTSSDDLEEDAPPIPVKTNESFRVPGEEPHESVQHSSKGTMERGFAGFKKMIKTGKGSLPKFISEVSLPHVSLPRSNSSGSGVTTRSDADLGYKKRVTSPKGPRSCPKHWPSFAQFGL